MKKLTLDEFIALRQADPNGTCGNGYVKEPDFAELYVRFNRRYIEGRWCEPTLDLANIKVRKPGCGTFTKLIERLRRVYPDMTLYVESVFDIRFRVKLVRMGFRPVGPAKDCFVLYANAHALPDKSRQDFVSSGH